MSCRKDANKAILDKAFKDNINNRPTFRRVGLSSFEITSTANNKSTTLGRQQALAIAKNTINRISGQFNGHIVGRIENNNDQSPIKVVLKATDEYIDYVFNSQVKSEDKTGALLSSSPLASSSLQNQVNSNTGPNTVQNLNPIQYANPTVGYLTRLIENKQQTLSELEQRLKKTNIELGRKGVGIAELKALNKTKRELTTDIYGIEGQKVGLKEEILTLTKNGNTLALGYYVEKDLQRIDKLKSSDNIDDLNEAKRLIQFYELGGRFSFDATKGEQWANPFFEKEDAYITDAAGNLTKDLKITQTDLAQYQEWSNKAAEAKEEVSKGLMDIATGIINEDISVKKTYNNKQFTFGEISYADTGLRDAHFIDAWLMDLTNGILSKNGVIAQTIFSTLTSSITTKDQYAKHFQEKVEHLAPQTIKRLKEIGQTLKSLGIDGSSQGVFTVFLEKNGEGQLSGGYAHKYNAVYQNSIDIVNNTFKKEWDKASIESDPNLRKGLFYGAFANKRKWHRNNTILIEFNKLPEIINDVEFVDYAQKFDLAGSNAYKNEIISIVGQKHYDEQVEEQKRLLRLYKADKENYIDTLMVEQGVTSAMQLNQQNVSAVNRWITGNSPLFGMNDYFDVNFNDGNSSGNYQNYNVFIPRKTHADYVGSIDNKSLIFTNNANKFDIDYYNSEFEKVIENDDTLYPFYKLLKESMDYVKSVAPPDIANKLAFNNLSALEKTSAELITRDGAATGSTMRKVFAPFNQWWERTRLSYGIRKQANLSFETQNSLTGEKNYTVNDSFLRDKRKAIQDRVDIEIVRFKQADGLLSLNNKLKKFNTIPLASLNTSALVLLTEYLGIDTTLTAIRSKDATLMNKIKARTTENVQIKKVIEDYATHETVKEQSYDLPKIIKHFTNMAAQYAARTEAKPKIDLLKKIYEGIQETKTNNIQEAIFNIPNAKNEVDGLRSNAIKQSANWYERVALNNFQEKHFGKLGSSKRNDSNQDRIDNITKAIPNASSLEEIKQLEKERQELIKKDKIRTIGSSIYSRDEAKKFADIEVLLGDLTDDERDREKNRVEIDRLRGILDDPFSPAADKQIAGPQLEKLAERNKLLNIQSKLGKTRVASAAIENLLGWVRTLKLAYSLVSGTTNMIEGWVSNMVLAATGEYFDSNEVYYAYSVVKSSMVKNMSFGLVETTNAKKNRMLMDMFDILMDSKNELQKASIKTFSDKLNGLAPHAINQRVEYVNQSVLMIAMLRSMKIKGINGEESNLWDAYGIDRQLKAEFRMPDNIENWENLTGKDYVAFKEKLRKVIVLGHGNYDELRGMMAKSNTWGKMILMFKTWLPQQLYWRFATEQDDIQSGTQGFKGKYYSYGAGSAFLHGTIVGSALLTPVVGPLIGIAAAGLAGGFNRFGKNNLNPLSTDNSVGLLRELVVSAQVLAKKMVGMPINSIAGRKIIGTSGSEFDKWVGKKGFDQSDANALKANMSDIAVQLMWIGMMLITKMMFWDDDDDEDSAERMAHNLLMNKIMQLSNQAALYVNPVEGHSTTVGSIAIIAYLQDVGKVFTALGDAAQGNDEIQGGINKGESKTANALAKVTIPSLLKDGNPLIQLAKGKVPSLGFGKLTERQFTPSPLDAMFKTNYTRQRQELKEKLEDEGKSVKEINTELNDKLPTKARLKKAHIKRQDWLNGERPPEQPRRSKEEVEEERQQKIRDRQNGD